MDGNTNNGEQLMSTMGNRMSANKDEKNDANDSTPTSSTDAHMSTSIQIHVTDDPISSTSSDVVETSESNEKNLTKTETDNSTNTVVSTELITPSTTTSIVPEKDLLDINMTDIPTEKITENVDDIVQDLENLLGEPTTSYLSPRSKEKEVKKTDDGLLDKIISSNLIETENLELPKDESENTVKNNEESNIETISLSTDEKQIEKEIIEEPQIVKEKLDEVVVEEKKEEVLQGEDKEKDSNEVVLETLNPPEVTAEVLPSESSEMTEKITNLVNENDAIDKSKDVIALDILPDVESDKMDVESGLRNDAETVKETSTILDINESNLSETKQISNPTIDESKENTISLEENIENINEDNKNIIGNVEINAVEEKMDVDEIKIEEEQSDQIRLDLQDEDSRRIEQMEVDESVTINEIIENISKAEPEQKAIIIEPNLLQEKEQEQEVTAKVEVISEQKVSDELPQNDVRNSNENVIKETVIADVSNLEEKINEINPELVSEVVQINEELISTIEPEKMDTTDNSVGIETAVLSIPLENTEATILEPVEDECKLIEDSIETQNNVTISLVNTSSEKESVVEEKEPIVLEKAVISALVENEAISEPIVPEIVETKQLEEIVDSENCNIGNKLGDKVQQIETEPEVIHKSPEKLETGLTEESNQLVVNKVDENKELVETVNNLQVEEKESLVPEILRTEESKELNEPVKEIITEENSLEDLTEICESTSEMHEEKIYEQPICIEESNRDLIKEDVSVLIQAAEESRQRGNTFEITTSSIIETEDIAKNMEEQSNELKNKDIKEPLIIDIDDNNIEKEKPYSPRLLIKPIIKEPSDELVVSTSNIETESIRGSLKMTITKQSNTMHSILKIYNPEDEQLSHQILDENNKRRNSPDCQEQNEQIVPKLIIKSIQSNEQQHSPKISTRSSKQVFSPTIVTNQKTNSPRITIKPILKPETTLSPIKLTIKPVTKTDDNQRQRNSPKLIVKPIINPDEEKETNRVHSPRITIKPIVKSAEEQEQELQQQLLQQSSSPRITIKPIIKPVSEGNVECIGTTPKVTIKPIIRPSDTEQTSPKIIIKPIVKPSQPSIITTTAAAVTDTDLQMIDFEEEIKQRIVLKINKGNLPQSINKESEKLAKIKLKFSKEDGHPHIVHQDDANNSNNKRTINEIDYEKSKKLKFDNEHLSGVTITPINTNLQQQHSKLKEILTINNQSCSSSSSSSSSNNNCNNDNNNIHIVRDESTSSEDIKIVDNVINKTPTSPIVISEDSTQDDSLNDKKDPLAAIPVFEISVNQVKSGTNSNTDLSSTFISDTPPLPPTPRKRGRPRKVPLQVREDFKDPKEEEQPKIQIQESTRPKRSCRGQSVRTTLGIKPRKPRGPGRGRGSKRGVGTRVVPMKPAKEPKLSAAKLKLMKESFLLTNDNKNSGIQQKDYDDSFLKTPLLLSQRNETCTDRVDIVMYEEETRMSAETNSSRAQTPAKQVISATGVDIEESQSSVQSTATTESVKVRKGPRLEVHQEPEGAVISADQLAEYYWSGGGPYMLQEQVAQFLGIKSFKRKYPNIARRFVDMQERDFIRESGLACEAMCDLGLTAVNSADILDIMYSDFQDKYEEYCKHQRDRQAKDLTNKQKALSLAASQEKNKIDITQQAINSAATWNVTFNKTRREQRKACMDLQTLTVHFPKGKIKAIEKPKIGHYPLALVPGQFTDYYEEFTPTEINNLPLNTMCYDAINIGGLSEEMDCDSQSDGSVSDSDSSSSDSDSSNSESSDVENCTICKPTPGKRIIVT